MPSGPQQFDLVVYDTYKTGDPAAPIDGVNIQGTVTVTINWNPGGTDLTAEGVVFSGAVWGDAGSGPLTVYDEALGGGIQPVGTATWSVRTQSKKTMVPDTPNKRYRWTITPIVELVRTVTSTVGNPTDAEVVGNASDNAQGGWMAQS